MKKIAILRCLRSNDVCTGAGCLQALHTRSGTFRCYGSEEVQLVAFWSCNGCGDVRLTNEKGLREKIERIIAVRTDTVHVGVCTQFWNIDTGIKQECKYISDIVEILAKYDIKIIRGTHV